MGSAFTDREREIIMGKLKAAASEYATTIGMRKTTIDDLTNKANISKGAFYHFYPSKEQLFFEILEDWHEELYEEALKNLMESPELPLPKRAENTIFGVIARLDEYNLLPFVENDLEIMMRKIPQEVIDKHMHEDVSLIERLFTEAEIELNVSFDTVTGLVHTIFFTMMQKERFKDTYPAVLKLLVESICEKVFKE